MNPRVLIGLVVLAVRSPSPRRRRGWACSGLTPPPTALGCNLRSAVELPNPAWMLALRTAASRALSVPPRPVTGPRP